MCVSRAVRGRGKALKGCYVARIESSVARMVGAKGHKMMLGYLSMV